MTLVKDVLWSVLSCLPLQDAVRVLIRHSADVNARDKNWQTPLHVAAANNALRCAEVIIPLLSSVNVSDRGGRTALHHAALNGHTEVLQAESRLNQLFPVQFSWRGRLWCKWPSVAILVGWIEETGGRVELYQWGFEVGGAFSFLTESFRNVPELKLICCFHHQQQILHSFQATSEPGDELCLCVHRVVPTNPSSSACFPSDGEPSAC